MLKIVLPVLLLNAQGLDALLTRHVDPRGMVNYAALKADGAALDRELAAMATAKPSGLAFWINAYNACCIKGVVKRYPLDSVMNVSGFFKEKAYTVAGETVSLDDIEHTKIRPVFKDPRIHAALVCAAKSCPRLSNRAYTEAGLNAELDAQVRGWLADATKNRFEPPSTAHLSMIFKWYAEDFGDVLAWVKKYAPAYQPATTLKHLEYDWSLNAQ